tara:strand:- start:852 stop:1622 length:771 start_codon:yes stop_codon:yes gene_type:complete
MRLTKVLTRSLKENGYCVIPNVLDSQSLDKVREAMAKAIEKTKKRGHSTHIPGLDPNEQNVRVFNLLDLDPLFLELITHSTALDLVRYLITEDFIISNFTANIARPGSGSMTMHSDLSLVHPPPWTEPWSINIIWVLNDSREENGATRYLPGSHNFENLSDLPDNAREKMLPLEAKQGSIIAMDGRLWHTSGENRTLSEERSLLFGYYTRSFLRPQWNYNVGLSKDTKSSLTPELQHWLGLGLTANAYTGDTSNHQ